MKDAVHGIFVINADVSIGVDIHFERLELEAGLVRLVVKGNRAEVRQIGLGADGRVFRNDDRDLVSLVLIGERFDVRQYGGNSTFGMTLVVAEFGGRALSLLRARSPHTVTPSSSSNIRLVSSIPVGPGLEVCGTASPTDRSCPGRLRKTHLCGRHRMGRDS